ncbi:MAG: hypothetical protein Q8M98_06060 [Candidatus Cloacimonadaceae bacterium]|nr:hypothetical protein [Candidatus Cloacimonadaceae bacterium]
MKRLLWLILTLLALAGCVQYDEELWLNQDGSGKAKIRLVHRSTYENPEEIMRKAALPGINLIDSIISRVGPNVIYTVTFKFANIEAFNNVNDQLSNADFWGKITLNREPGGKVNFKRRIALGSQEEEDDFETLFSQMQTEHPVWNYKLHLPWKIVSSNAAEDKIDRGKRVISWSYDTAQMWNKHEYMIVEMEKGYPWTIIIIVMSVLIFLGFFAFWMIRIARRSHLLERLIHHQESVKPTETSSEKQE